MLNQSLHLKLLQQRLFKAMQYLFSHWSLVTTTTTTTKSQFYLEDNVPRSKTTCPRFFEARGEYVTKFWSMMCKQNYCVGLSEGLLKWSWPFDRNTLLSSTLLNLAPWNVDVIAGALKPFLTPGEFQNESLRLGWQNNNMILSLWWPPYTTGLSVSGHL